MTRPRPIQLLLPLALAMAPASAAPQAAPAASADSVVTRYCAVWGIADAAERDAAIQQVWAVDGTYSDPQPLHVSGRTGLSAAIAEFQRQNPGTYFRCSAAQSHHGYVRFSWRMFSADGVERLVGMDFGEVDAEGRLRRIVGFFGPPLPVTIAGETPAP